MNTLNNVPTTPDELARAIQETIPEELWSRMGGGRQQALIRQWEGLVDERSQAGSPDVEVPAEIETTPAASWARADWIRDLEPYVRSLRIRFFDGLRAPFSRERWGEAVEWLERQHARESKSRRQRLESALESEEYYRRLARARADAEWLSGRTGVPFVLRMTASLPLAYADEEEDRVRVLYSHPEEPLFPLARAVGTISDLTGFDPHAVTSWILAGVEPPPSRVRVRASVVERPLLGPDSDAHGWRSAPRVMVTLHTDDLRHRDLRALHSAVRAAWRQIAAADPRTVKEEARESARSKGRALDEEEEARESTRRQGRAPDENHKRSARPGGRSRLTAADMALRAIIENVGEPSRGSELTWEDVRKRWEKAGHKQSTSEALRKRWERAKKKVERLPGPQIEIRGAAQGVSVPLDYGRDPGEIDEGTALR